MAIIHRGSEEQPKDVEISNHHLFLKNGILSLSIRSDDQEGFVVNVGYRGSLQEHPHGLGYVHGGIPEETVLPSTQADPEDWKTWMLTAAGTTCFSM